jgi:hypothetical protein
VECSVESIVACGDRHGLDNHCIVLKPLAKERDLLIGVENGTDSLEGKLEQFGTAGVSRVFGCPSDFYSTTTTSLSVGCSRALKIVGLTKRRKRRSTRV